jgi:hypothetical protein
MALSHRGEDDILSSDPREAAHPIAIAKLQASICRGTGNGIDGENATSRLVLPRPALMISRIVSRSLFDFPLNNVRPAFSTRGS